MRHTEHLALQDCVPVAQPSGRVRSTARACGAQVASGSGDHDGYPEVGELEGKRNDQVRQDGDALQPVQLASQNGVLMC